MMSPYRDAASIPIEAKPVPVCRQRQEIQVGDGTLVRSKFCGVPGRFGTWWHNIKVGDLWRCRRCDTEYRLVADGSWMREGKQ